MADQEVCFGMLKNIQITLVRPRNGQDIQVAPWETRDGYVVLASLDLVFAQDYCDIQAPNSGITVARLNKRTQHALVLVERSESLAGKVQYRALLPLAELHQRLGRLEPQISKLTGSSQASWSMSMLITGPRSISQTLAKALSRQRLYLQHPSTQVLPEDISYENPQYLAMVGSSLSNGALLAPMLLGPNQEMESSEIKMASQQTETRSLDDDVVDVITMLDHLPRHEYLMQAPVDSRIVTVLLPHQKEGLDYVVGRESAEKMHERPHSLWRLETRGSQEPVYCHVISGVKNSAPTDILGGMLADDMGLGKTLTMIATIVTTMPQAEQHMNTTSPSNQPSIPVKSTLVIVPSVLLLDGWVDEMNKHVAPGTLSYHKYHGPGRVLPSKSPLPYHVVLTTYGTVTADFRRGGGVLECFHWHRVILDEAHVIRNSSTKQFQAVAKLTSAIRWCMTGTPIQNSLFDLGSLVKFLRVPLLEDPAVFRKHVVGKRTQGIFMRKPDAANLERLVGAICLRRNAAAILLPHSVSAPVAVQRRPDLARWERRAYDRLAQSCRRAIDAVVRNKRTKRGNNMILTALLKLRLFCNNGPSVMMTTTMTTEQHDDDDQGPAEGEEGFVHSLHADEVISLLQQSGDATCATCGADLDSFDRVQDGAAALGSGARGTKPQKTNLSRLRLKCQDCTKETKKSVVEKVEVDSAEHLGGAGPGSSSAAPPGAGGDTTLLYPAKLQALLDDLQEHQSQDKSIVFSFWKRSLRLVARLLAHHGIPCTRVDGDLSPRQRREALDAFRERPDTRVLLMTLGTGAVGLNDLSVASRVHILEPQWNPSTESQAIGRVLRLGQEKRVTIVRYIVKNSIEESVESRQMMKVQLALKGGLHSSDDLGISEGQQRISRLQELSKMIQATILPDDDTAPPEEEPLPRGRKRPREALESDAEMDWVPQ